LGFGGFGLINGNRQGGAGESGFMLKQRTPFAGRRVVRGRAATKFPAAVTVPDEVHGAEGGYYSAFSREHSE
jgi:hypothetical protein